MAKKYRDHFESLGDYVAFAKRPAIHKSHVSSREERNAGWAGTRTFEEAVNLVENGWKEGRGLLLDAIAEAESTPFMTPALSMDVGGAYPIAAIAAAGDPLSMVNLEPVEDRVRPIVRLVVCRNASAAYGSKELMNYGAAVLSYVEGLEQMKYRVELTIATGDTVSGGTNLTTVLVKRAEEHIEFDRMAFVLAHTAFLRRISFSVMERTPGLNEDMGSYYGYPRNPTPEEVDPNQIIIPGVNSIGPDNPALKSSKACLKHIGPMIEKQLRSAGIAPPPFEFTVPDKVA